MFVVVECDAKLMVSKDLFKHYSLKLVISADIISNILIL